MKLVQSGELSFERLIHALTAGPASVVGFKDRGSLKEGMLADFTILEKDQAWTFEKSSVFSKSLNSPFFGMSLKGRVIQTVVGGQIVFDLNKVRKEK